MRIQSGLGWVVGWAEPSTPTEDVPLKVRWNGVWSGQTELMLGAHDKQTDMDMVEAVDASTRGCEAEGDYGGSRGPIGLPMNPPLSVKPARCWLSGPRHPRVFFLKKCFSSAVSSSV